MVKLMYHKYMTDYRCLMKMSSAMCRMTLQCKVAVHIRITCYKKKLKEGVFLCNILRS